MLRRLFLEHPQSLGETYTEHRRAAARVGGAMIAAGAACLIHSIVPSLFATTASSAVARLNTQVIARRQVALTSSREAARRD